MNEALITVESVKRFINDALRRNRVFNKEQIIKYYGMTEYMLNKFIHMGMPWHGTIRKRVFYLCDVQKWFNDNQIKDYMI